MTFEQIRCAVIISPNLDNKHSIKINVYTNNTSKSYSTECSLLNTRALNFRSNYLVRYKEITEEMREIVKALFDISMISLWFEVPLSKDKVSSSSFNCLRFTLGTFIKEKYKQ